VTPPPCILRKNRRDQENNNPNVGNNTLKNAQKESEQVKECSLSFLPESGMLHRSSSGSSLSTLTADTYAHISNPSINDTTFLSLRRVKGAKVNGYLANQNASLSMKPPLNYSHRQASSVNGSPLMSNGHQNQVLNQHIRRNGYSSHNSSPNSTFDRNIMFNPSNEFQLEKNLMSMNKDLEFITQEVKQLDVDVTGIRQDVGTVQENIVSVRGAAEAARSKANKLQNHVNYIEKQIASIIEVLYFKILKLIKHSSI
jgi:hypothetical protein